MIHSRLNIGEPVYYKKAQYAAGTFRVSWHWVLSTVARRSLVEGVTGRLLGYNYVVRMPGGGHNNLTQPYEMQTVGDTPTFLMC